MARRMHWSQARQGSTVGRVESLELGKEYSARPSQEASVACKAHHSLRTEVQSGFQTAYHQGLGWKWPNQTLPPAWPTSNQFNLEISVQATGAQLVHNSLIFFCYQFFQDMCPILWELSDHVPWVRTITFIFFQKSIFIFLNGSPNFIFSRHEHCVALSSAFPHPWRCVFLSSLWVGVRFGVFSSAVEVMWKEGSWHALNQGASWTFSTLIAFYSPLFASTRPGEPSAFPRLIWSCLCQCPRQK